MKSPEMKCAEFRVTHNCTYGFPVHSDLWVRVSSTTSFERRHSRLHYLSTPLPKHLTLVPQLKICETVQTFKKALILRQIRYVKNWYIRHIEALSRWWVRTRLRSFWLRHSRPTTGFFKAPEAWSTHLTNWQSSPLSTTSSKEDDQQHRQVTMAASVPVFTLTNGVAKGSVVKMPGIGIGCVASSSVRVWIGLDWLCSAVVG